MSRSDQFELPVLIALPTDFALLEDPQFRIYVEALAASHTDLALVFSAAFARLIALGFQPAGSFQRSFFFTV